MLVYDSLHNKLNMGDIVLMPYYYNNDHSGLIIICEIIARGTDSIAFQILHSLYDPTDGARPTFRNKIYRIPIPHDNYILKKVLKLDKDTICDQIIVAKLSKEL